MKVSNIINSEQSEQTNLNEINSEQINLLWEKYNVYKWDCNKPRSLNFTIDSPPPTISGSLHIGHFFSYTQCDIIARYQRMIGKNVFYPIGYDNNGLPTERLTEKELDTHINMMQRSNFINKCREIINKYEQEFRKTIKLMGLSIDWSLHYDTISKKSISVSQMSFIDLYNKGLIEKRSAPSFWDVIDNTALSQGEIEDKEKIGIMYDILFKYVRSVSNNAFDVVMHDIIVSTSRPEMLPACVAVLYHPDDDRYKHLNGYKAVVPFTGKIVPILPDEDVIPEKGTGVVMCCTFGDIQDIVWWRRHKLPIIDIIGRDGLMKNTQVFDNLSVIEARKVMLCKLDDEIYKKETTKQILKCGERSGFPLEIIVSDQWYIKIIENSDNFIKIGQDINWYPKNMKNRYESWINGLNQEWCISRQRYLGVPFPVWYSKRSGEEGKILIASPKQLPVDPMVDLPEGYERYEVEADCNVMDTWATSALTPQLLSGYITEEISYNNNYNQNKDDNNLDDSLDNSLCSISSKEIHDKIFPFDIRTQAHEIIRTWTFGTVVKSFYHQQTKPWKNILLSGWCLSDDKKKISKSKGNITFTLNELLNTWGADAMRYWSGNASLGNDTIYNEKSFQTGKRFINKLRNATKFITSHAGHLKKEDYCDIEFLMNESVGFDYWILLKLNETIKVATSYFDKFEYSEALNRIESFFWRVFCDYYLELIKVRVYDLHTNNNDEDDNIETINDMYDVFMNKDSLVLKSDPIRISMYVLETTLRLLAPFFPYITEELFQVYISPMRNNPPESIHKRGNWPSLIQDIYSVKSINKVFEKIGDECISILQMIHKYKSMQKLSIKSQIEKLNVYGCIFKGSNCNLEFDFNKYDNNNVNYHFYNYENDDNYDDSENSQFYKDLSVGKNYLKINTYIQENNKNFKNLINNQDMEEAKMNLKAFIVDLKNTGSINSIEFQGALPYVKHYSLKSECGTYSIEVEND
ncbi:valine--tRNA ligase [Lyticum sinuosum]|uniref:valine--tRNA ligase n=1 Tax=Lyticum sinuosum TaxID=1332059 RepID=A0AAE4VJP4_9RICK|nr:valine--tRNA ligase [Lyticum sinuosum]MDZ5761067.1 Valine--tRNA ligase [Lyticum sinuosum]